MRLFAKPARQADNDSDGAYSRANAPAFTHVTGFDGGEAPLGRVIRNLICRRSKSAITASTSKITRRAAVRNYVQDGGQSQAWVYSHDKGWRPLTKVTSET